MKKILLLVLLPFGSAAALAVVWTEGQRLVGHDSFAYLEYTKQLTESWPTAFGTIWPYGYPFVASFLSQLGLSAYYSLLFISATSLLCLFALSAQMVDSSQENIGWVTATTFLALGCVPEIPKLLYDNMSELLFSCLLLGIAFSMACWPKRRAVWTSLFLGFSSFCVRYAGVFTFGLIGLWFILNYKRIHARKNLFFVVSWYLFFIGLSLLLLWVNVEVTGYLSGGERGSGGGFAEALIQVAHLGWSVPGMLSSSQISKYAGGVESLLGLSVGWLAIIALVAFAAYSFWRPVTSFTRPLVLTTLSYLASLVFFRSLKSFVDLSSPRFFVPVLFPVAILLLGQLRGRMRKVLGIGAVLVVAVGVGLGIRGNSKATYGDVHYARQVLERELSPGDTVLVNEQGRSLAAYFSNTFDRREKEIERKLPKTDYLVVVAERHGRAGKEYRFAPQWKEHIKQAISGSNNFSIVDGDSTAYVLEGIE